MRYPIRASRSALLVFDAQSAFLAPDDPAEMAAIAESGVIHALRRAIDACRERGMLVCYSRVDHRPDLTDMAPLVVDVDRGGVRTDGPFVASGTRVTPGTPRAEIVAELAPEPEDVIVSKQRWSAFHATNLSLLLRRRGVDTLLLAGSYTDIGVASTAYAAHDRDFNLVILRDACRSRRPLSSAFFLDQVFPLFSRVMTVDEAIGLMEDDAPPRDERQPAREED